MGRLTQEGILADLIAELSQRSTGYRASFNYRHVVEREDGSEVARMADITAFTLEDEAPRSNRVIAFYVTQRAKILSDPSPEQQSRTPWKIGTLEDAAKVVWDVLEVQPS